MTPLTLSSTEYLSAPLCHGIVLHRLDTQGQTVLCPIEAYDPYRHFLAHGKHVLGPLAPVPSYLAGGNEAIYTAQVYKSPEILDRTNDSGQFHAHCQSLFETFDLGLSLFLKERPSGQNYVPSVIFVLQYLEGVGLAHVEIAVLAYLEVHLGERTKAPDPRDRNLISRP